MAIGEIGAAVAKAAEVTAEVAEKSAEVAAKIEKAAEVTGKISEIKASGITLEQAKGFIDSKVKAFDEITDKLGGKYSDLKNDIDPETKTNKTEKHHMPLIYTTFLSIYFNK